MFITLIHTKKGKKRKRNIHVRIMAALSLVEDCNLVWCLHYDFWGSLVLLDEANNLDLFAQVEILWNKRESGEIGSKDDGRKVLVVGVEVKETHNTGIVSVDDCPFNNDILVKVVVCIGPVDHGDIVSPS